MCADIDILSLIDNFPHNFQKYVRKEFKEMFSLKCAGKDCICYLRQIHYFHLLPMNFEVGKLSCIMFLRSIIRMQRYVNSVPDVHIFKPVPLFIRKIACWKCGRNHENGSECFVCHAIQDPDKINYFELLEQKETYDIDSKTLVTSYHDLQIRYHPDKHSNETEEEKKKAETFSSLVNKAYSTLLDPVARGTYLLHLRGISIDDKGTSFKNHHLLQKMLNYNDDIQRIKVASQAENLKRKFLAEIKNLSQEVSKAFAEENYEAAEDIIINMKYHRNLLRKLTKKANTL